MLLQNGGDVGLGNIIFEGTVAEDHRGVARGFELLMPLGNTEGQWLDVSPSDLLVKAGDQRTGSDGAHGLANDGPGLDRYAKVEAQLEQQLAADVVLGFDPA